MSNPHLYCRPEEGESSNLHVNMNHIVGSHHLVLVTLDTLRYDAARAALAEGMTPGFAGLLPGGVWELRHSPGSFTYAAHQAFFAGFLPTPAIPGKHARLFALRFPGSETTTPQTCVLDAPDLVTGLAERGYRTLCVGGVGFFNGLTPLGRVLPGLFQEHYWRREFGVTDPASTEHQVTFISRHLSELPPMEKFFLFVNISAIHQPNYFYYPGAIRDSLASHKAALAYVDRALVPLWRHLRQRGPTFVIVCSDHGTAYGEEGYEGHRLAHRVVWEVPYSQFLLLPKTT